MRTAALILLGVLGLACVWVIGSSIHLQAVKRGRVLADRQLLIHLVTSNTIPENYSWIRPFSKSILLGGRTQQCVFAAWHPIYRDGRLVITKEHFVVWLDVDGETKTIDENYWPPLFSSERF